MSLTTKKTTYIKNISDIINTVDRRKKIIIGKFIYKKYGATSFIDKKKCNKLYVKSAILENLTEEELENIFKFLLEV